MPALILFAPCEKVIINETDQTTSVISLLEAVRVAPIPDAELAKIPEDAVAQVSWHILALWQADEDDYANKLETRFGIAFPSGKKVNVGEPMPIEFIYPKPNYRSVLKVIGIPLYPLLINKRCNVQVLLRVNGGEWDLKGEFPVVVRQGN